jgi:hypothetical protein
MRERESAVIRSEEEVEEEGTRGSKRQKEKERKRK